MKSTFLLGLSLVLLVVAMDVYAKPGHTSQDEIVPHQGALDSSAQETKTKSDHVIKEAVWKIDGDLKFLTVRTEKGVKSVKYRRKDIENWIDLSESLGAKASSWGRVGQDEIKDGEVYEIQAFRADGMLETMEIVVKEDTQSILSVKVEPAPVEKPKLDMKTLTQGSRLVPPEVLAQERANYYASQGNIRARILGTGHVMTSKGAYVEELGWSLGKSNSLPPLSREQEELIFDGKAKAKNGYEFQSRLYPPGSYRPKYGPNRTR